MRIRSAHRFIVAASLCGPMCLGTRVAIAQDQPLPAAAPPNLPQPSSRPSPAAPPSVSELLAKAGLTPESVAKRRADPKQTPLPAASPPSVPAQAAPNHASAPTLDQLIQKLRALPGGAEALDRAQHGSTRPPSTEFGSLWHLVSVPAAHRIRRAGPARTAARMSIGPVRVTPANPVASALMGSFTVTLAACMGIRLDVRTYGLGDDCLFSQNTGTDPVVGTRDGTPYGVINVSVPNTGYYLINFETYGSVPAILRSWTGSGWQTIYTWNYAFGSQSQTYPALIQLAAGAHTFAWVYNLPANYTYSVYFHAASLTLY